MAPDPEDEPDSFFGQTKPETETKARPETEGKAKPETKGANESNLILSDFFWFLDLINVCGELFLWLVIPDCKQNMTSLRGQASWAKMMLVGGKVNSTGMPPN